jgi:ADP-ribose pyrophosphatase YjhB (NUDIX family)
MRTLKRKVLAYIVHQGKLLVYRQRGFPEAGFHIPGGTIDEGETPEAAVLRKAHEETGLDELKVVRLLGEQVRMMTSRSRDQIHHRYYFLLKCTGTPPESWGCAEHKPSAKSTDPIWLEFSWARLPNNIPELSGGQDYCLSKMIDYLITTGECFN